jgi:hypothetical protein
MKKSAIIGIYAVLAISLVIIIGLKSYDVESAAWKYASGEGSIGDWIEFKSTVYSERNDAIFKTTQAVTLILKVTKSEMIIKNLINGQNARYINKK